MTGRLLHRPKPIAGESFYGYLLRLAEANGYVSDRWITELAGIEGRLSTGTGDVEPLARLLGHDPALLEAMRYPPSPWAGRRRINLFNGRPINRLAINIDRPRVCPACLTDSPHLRMAWELAPTAICPSHGTVLLDACPTCGKAISWNRSHVCQCHHCGTDFRKAVPPQADSRGAGLSALLLAAAGLAEAPAEGHGFPTELRTLSLADLVQALLLLGAAASGLPFAGGHWSCTKLSTGEMAKLLKDAAEALGDWPNGLHTLLEKLNGKMPPGHTGLQWSFGRFYTGLFRDLQGTNLGFLRKEVEAFASQKWTGGSLTGRNRRFSEMGRHSTRFACRSEAARKLHVRPETIDELLNAGLLRGERRQAGSRSITLIDRESLKHGLDGLLELEDVCRLLGLSRGPVKDLAAAGHLRRVILGKGERRRPYYLREEAEELMASLMGDAPERDDNLPYIALAGAVRWLSFHGLGVADLVSEVLAGGLSVKARRPAKRGLTACLFEEGDILALIHRHRVARGDALTIPEAADRLRIKQQVAYQLVRVGLWPVTRAWENGRPLHLVPAEALAKFNRDYVAAAKLADLVGTSARHLVDELASQGIKPVTGPSIDDSRQYFFERMPATRAVEQTAFPLGDTVAF
jgi:hypothetical protein